MLIVCYILLGLISIVEYSTDSDKAKKYISYTRIAIMFLSIGINLGKLGF
ncbi:hypothetical protein [Clostridium novyi]|nr:hypothetical protein [Clostridium novyi]